MESERAEAERLRTLYRSLRRVLLRAYPALESEDIDDSIQYAMNRYCVNVPDNVRRSDAALFCWLATIARRRLWAEMLRRRRMALLGDRDEQWERLLPRIDDATVLACTSSVVRILSHLTPAAARAIWLHDVEEWKPSEIASQMGCSTNAVNHRVKRARVRLRRMLQDDGAL